MPDICVARIDLLCTCCAGDRTHFQIVQHLFTALEIPESPWRNDWKVRRKRSKCALESNLIVALAGATVAECIAIFSKCDFDLRACNDRSRNRSSQEISTFIDRASDRHWICELFEEGLAQILDHAFGRTRANCFLLNSFKFSRTLTNICHDGDDFASICLNEPWNDAGSIETSGICE